VARQPLQLVVAEADVGYQRPRVRRSPRQRVRVGPGSEQVAAARRLPRKKEKVELLPPGVVDFRN